MPSVNRLSFIVICNLYVFILAAQAPRLIPFREGELWGLKNEKDSIVFEPNFYFVTPLTDSVYYLFLNDNKYILGKNISRCRLGVIYPKEAIPEDERPFYSKRQYKSELGPEFYQKQIQISGHIIAVYRGERQTYSRKDPKEYNNRYYFVNLRDMDEISKYYYKIRDFCQGYAPVCNEVETEEYRHENLWGFIDETGNEVIPPKYKDVTYFNGKFAGFKDKITNKWGIMNTKGEEMLPPQFITLKQANIGFIAETAYKHFVYIDTSLHVTAIEGEYDMINCLDNGDILCYKKFRYYKYHQGYFNMSLKKLIIPCMYDTIFVLSDQYLISSVYLKEKEYSQKSLFDFHTGTLIADNLGYWIYKPQEKIEIHKYNDDLCYYIDGKNVINGNCRKIIITQDKWLKIEYTNTTNYISLSDQRIIPSEYQIFSIIGDYAYYFLRGKYGVITTSGKKITDAVYEEIKPFSEGLACVKRNGLYGFIDTTGLEVIPPQWAFAENYREGRVPVANKWNKFGFIDFKGNRLTSLKYPSADSWNKDYAVLHCKGPDKYTLFSNKILDLNNGKIVLKNYLFVFMTDEGFIVVKEKYGFLDPKLNPLIPMIYENLEYYGKGILISKKEGKFGIISTKGQEILACEYDDIQNAAKVILNADSSCFIIQKAGKKGVFHMALNVIIPCIYDNIKISGDGYITTELEGKKGLFNLEGRVILPCKYDEIILPENNNYIIVKDEFYGLYDKKGQEIIAPSFNYFENNKDGIVFQYNYRQDAQDLYIRFTLYNDRSIEFSYKPWVYEFRGLL